MGHKKVCMDCHIALNRAFDGEGQSVCKCPQCGEPMVLLPHRFRPPEKSNDRKWETVKFLVKNGFRYQHIWETILFDGKVIGNKGYAKYPDNMKDAKEFVIRYKDQASK